MVHFQAGAGFHHQAGAGSQALANQVVMHRRSRKKRRNRGAPGVHAPVGQNQNVFAAPHRAFGARANALHGRAHAGRAVARRVANVNGRGRQRAAAVLADAPDEFQFVVAQNRVRRAQAHAAVVAAEQVRARARQRHQRHHQLLANRVYRRVGHLREVLLEIRGQMLAAHGKRRRRHIAAHGADRLGAAGEHRQQHELQILARAAEGALRPAQLFRRHFRRRVCLDAQFVQRDAGFVQPPPVAARRGELVLDFIVADDAPLFQIHQQHFAGLQPPLADDVGFGDAEHAGLRGHHHAPVARQHAARRAQAVAVQHRADLAAVGERHRGRPVPGLHQRGVVFVKRAARVRHVRVALPRLRNQHHHRVRERITAGQQQFQRGVQRGRIRLPAVNQRPNFFQAGAEQF